MVCQLVYLQIVENFAISVGIVVLYHETFDTCLIVFDTCDIQLLVSHRSVIPRNKKKTEEQLMKRSNKNMFFF